MSNPTLLEVDTKNSNPQKGQPFAVANCVNFIRRGQGVPVMMFHGLAASLHDWDFLVPELISAGFDACALDLLGHGDSQHPAHIEEYTMENVFSHLSDWVDSLALQEPAILIGHSLGGYLALEYALRFPERVRGLVLVNPFYSVRQLSSFLQFVFRRQLLNTALIDLTPYWMFRVVIDVTTISPDAGGGSVHYLPESVRMQTALDYKRASSGIYNIPRTMRDLTSDLPRLNVPSLVIWGTRDRTLAPNSFPELVHILPNARAEMLSPCGHVPHQCHADKFNPRVINFLKEFART
jgi:2-hydroxy-6-oxonona-2,4-dienedioate hydrolase